MLLYNAVLSTGLGHVYFAPVDVRFSGNDQVQPDLLVIRNERSGTYRGSTGHGASDIVVEILSPSNRSYDEERKARLYATASVPEYWILDPIAPDFRMLALTGAQYVPVTPEDGQLRSTVAPGLVINPAHLFALLCAD